MPQDSLNHVSQHRANYKTVYYDGTDTLATGYCLCYDQDATENGADPADRLGFTVEKPATANIMFFAGIYTGQQGGITDPGYITIEVPERGQMTEAWTDANMTLGSSGLACQDGDFGFGIHSDSAENFPLVALACITENTDSTNALSTVMWL